MKKLISFFLIFVTFSINAQILRRESYIDVPTAKFYEGLHINLNTSYPVGSENPVSFDINGGIQASINNYQAVLKWYDGADFALDVSYRIMKQSGSAPAIVVGLDNLTWNAYISPLGHQEGDTSPNTYSDEDYIDRAPEVASTYIVFTRTFNPNFEITGGIGRGRFIGYGPRSRFLNFDAFFGEDNRHENMVLGIFGGMKFSVPNGPAFVIETDGRDANLGVIYEYGMFRGSLGLLKLEQFFGESEELTPRINLNMSFKSKSFAGPQKGQIKIHLLSEITGKPLPGKIMVSDGDKKRVYDVPAGGIKTITLDPGSYMFSLTAPQYKSKKAKVRVYSNKVRNVTVKLREELSAKERSAIEYTKKAKKDFKDGNILDAKKKLEVALRLDSDCKPAIENLKIVKKAISDTVSSLRKKAISLEDSDPEKALSLWLEVLKWEPSNKEASRHVESLQEKKKEERRTTPRRTERRETEESKLSKAQIDRLYKEGIKAYINGNYAKAANNFRKILQSDPNHKGAKRYLKKAEAKL